jgi:hypothetical protein
MMPSTLLISTRRFQELGGYNPEFSNTLAEDF